MWAWGILKDSVRILLEMVPKGMDLEEIQNNLKSKFPQILEIYDMHLWTITSNMLIFSAYIKLSEEIITNGMYDEHISEITQYLEDEYNIVHSTIQITSKYVEGCVDI